METTLNSESVRSDIAFLLRASKQDYRFLQITIKDESISDKVQKFSINPNKLRIGKKDSFAKFSQNGFTYKADFNTTAYVMSLYVEVIDESSQITLRDINSNSYIDFYFTNDEKEIQPEIKQESEPEQPQLVPILEQKNNIIVDETLAIQLALTLEKFKYIRVDMAFNNLALNFMQNGCDIKGCEVSRSWNKGKYRLSFEPLCDDSSRWSFDLLPYCDYLIREDLADFTFKDNEGLEISVSMY